jgi:hypothetical protein
LQLSDRAWKSQQEIPLSRTLVCTRPAHFARP